MNNRGVKICFYKRVFLIFIDWLINLLVKIDNISEFDVIWCLLIDIEGCVIESNIIIF